MAEYLVSMDLLGGSGEQWRASQGRERRRDGAVALRVTDGGQSIEIDGGLVTVVAGRVGR
jgi:predicted PhzF superfamily epimerase YddE/YHI9